MVEETEKEALLLKLLVEQAVGFYPLPLLILLLVVILHLFLLPIVILFTVHLEEVLELMVLKEILQVGVVEQAVAVHLPMNLLEVVLSKVEQAVEEAVE
jgi:hypothetical protein